MRSIVEFLGYLRSRDVSLSLEGDALKCNAPQGVLTPDLRQELADRKPEIMSFLRTSRRVRRAGKPAISVMDRSGPLPLSLAQQRLWFLNQLDSNSAVNNIGAALRLRGDFDKAAFDLALMDTVQRHETLRTSFIQVHGEPQAVVGDGSDWKYETVDAHHFVDQVSESELLQYAGRLASQPFDIARGSLFRLHLLVLGPRDRLIVLAMHHMISDGWSMGVLVRDFSEMYEARIAGKQTTLPPLPVQYLDFAAWQRKWLESGELDRQLPYWQKQLAGAPPVSGFPSDHRRPPTEAFRGCRSKVVLQKETVSALKQLSRRHAVTLFMSLLAAFNVLLARYSGQEDVVLSSPTANRSLPELYRLIGFFVNNLVLRTDLNGNPSFTELLGRIREVTLHAYEHQDVPFDRLVHALRPERSLDHSPLFQVMFILQNFSLDNFEFAGLQAEPLEIEIGTARFDLSVEIFPRHGELWMYFDYNVDLYEPETIERIQQHYLALLNAVCADPTQKIASIPLLSAAERQKLLVDWNRTDAPIPDVCFHQQFEAHARAMPERLAVLAGVNSLTYGELDRRANRIAELLRSRGAGPGKLVAFCLPRSTDIVAAILGVAKSGAAYVPLDPIYPAGRLSNILEDAKPIAVLTTTDLLFALSAEHRDFSVDVICLDKVDDSDNILANRADQNAPPRSSHADPGDLAYVIFTSGSTGRPKGVEIAHRSLVNFLESMRKQPGLVAGDVLLAVTTVSFDIAGLELLLPLTTGATVCISLEPADPNGLLADLERYRPTVMQATPATWKLLIAAGWKGDPHLKILCGGEALGTDLARSLLVRSESLWNMYGPTETTIWSAVLQVDEVGTEPISIGRPILNTSFYVVDSLGQPAPQGAAGELWIGGEGVARGYLNRSDLTVERFVQMSFSEPIAANPNVRLYRTGDLVRYRADGTLDFLGRMDHQVKLRGFRIELGEIESELRNCSGVADALVVIREDKEDTRLVAYLVSAREEHPPVSAIRQHLRSILPEYMIPAAFVFLKEYPRLPNGKLDRSALPVPEQSVAVDKLNFVAPATSLQQTIADIFRHVLNIEQVGVDHNFFDLGAHSLQIVRVQEELNRRLESTVPLISFFQYPTIRMLAGFIEEQCHKEPCSVREAEGESQVR